MKKYSLQLFLAIVILIIAKPISAQISLPYTEGFEKIGSNTTFTTTTSSINGISTAYYQQTNTGRLRFSAGTGFYHSGSHAATMDSRTTSSYSTNYLILSLDLSNYTSSRLELSFYFMHHGEESNTDDRVWVRENSSASWVQIYDWYANRGTAGNWNYVKGLKIDSILARASQKVGKDFQLRFGQRDDYPATSTTASDGLTVDDISIIEILPNNGKVSGIGNYCDGNSPVKTTLTNNGTRVIQNATVKWWVDNKRQKDYHYTGNLNTKQSTSITLGNYNFTAGSHNFIAIVDSINGKDDGDKNDTLHVTQASTLSGTYTVYSGSGSDYQSPSDAVTDLVNKGICSSVVFKISNGTYSGALTIPAIAGASATNTITFEGEDSSKTIITYNGAARASTIQLSGASFITFKNLKIVGTSSTRSWGAHMYNKCHDLQFNHCWFSMPTTSSTTNFNGLVASNSTTSETTSADNVQDLIVTDCYFTGGSKGMSIMGDNRAYSQGYLFNSNIFKSINYIGMDIRYVSGMQISYNRMSSFSNNSSLGIYLNYINDFIISDNEVYANGYGFYAFYANVSNTSYSALQNNIFVGTGVYGAYLYLVQYIKMYHNSCRGVLGVRFNSFNGLDVRNNVFEGTTSAAFDGNTNGGFDFLDWNHYYSPISTPLRYNNTWYNSLSAWITAYPNYNANSFFGTIPFTSTTDLHLKTTSSFSRALPLGITKDVDRDARCKYAPSVGADESVYKDKAVKTNFTGPDTVYQNAKVQFNNGASPNDPLGFEWYENNTLVSSGSFNLEHQFTNLGMAVVKLVTLNCGNADTTYKTVYVKAITSAPIANFSASPLVASNLETVNFTDLSKNGVASFYWEITPYWGYDQIGNRVRNFDFVNGTDSSSVNPQVNFHISGQYSICLHVSNKFGATTMCKYNYISIKDGANMCDTKTESNLPNGNLYDPGGPNGNYIGLNYNCTFLIDACAKQVDLKFNSFSLTNNRDYLKIYDGADNKAPKLHNYTTAYNNGLTGSSTATGFRKTLTAKSGKVFFEFTTTANPGSSGFDVEWSIVPIKATPPVAKIEIPDTACNNLSINFQNLSSGKNNNYLWIISSKKTNSVTYTDSAVSHQFFFTGEYTVTLVVTNCGGVDSVSQDIVIVDPYSAPTAGYLVSSKRPDVGQKVIFSDNSKVFGYACTEALEWKFSPNKFSYVSGFNNTSSPTEVTFTDTGCYSLTLIVRNSSGYDTLVDPCAVRVKKTCVPKTGGLSKDIGIAEVIIGTIDNKSATGTAMYTDYRSTLSTDITLGDTTEIKIYRAPSPVVRLNRAVWIDYNQDGDFDDAGEVVAKSDTANTLFYEQFKFVVPTTALKGTTTLRIGVSNLNNKNLPCGTNPVGEYEDYTVNIIPDMVAPTIYLYGNADTTINQCSSWSDPSGYATDNITPGIISLTAKGTVNSSKVGIYYIDYTATDGQGNVAQAKRRVIVAKDITAPEVKLAGYDTVYVAIYNTYKEMGASADDPCGGSLTVDISGTVDTALIGTYELIYKATDLVGNIGVVNRYIIVRDLTAPLVSLVGPDTLYLNPMATYVEQGINYSDNYYPKSLLTVSKTSDYDSSVVGIYTVVYTVTDPSGNKTSITRYLMSGDAEPPKIVFIGSSVDTVDVFTIYNDAGVIVTDNLWKLKDITITEGGTYIAAFGKGGTANIVGKYTYEWSATDGSGNTGKAVRTIYVVDRVAPIISLKGSSTMDILLYNSYTEPGYTVSDNYWKTGNGLWVWTIGKVDTAKVGAYEIDYYATDSSGNASLVLTRTVNVGILIGYDQPVVKGKLLVYPNPTTGIFNLSLIDNSNQGFDYIEVQNVVGQTVYRSSFKPMENEVYQIDLNNQPAGTYMVILKSESQNMVERVLLQH